MVRKFAPEGKKRGSSILYWFAVAIIILLWVLAFRIYFNRYEDMHPDIAWASAGMKRTIIEVPGVLLWNERVINAPHAGRVTYPNGSGPIRVAQGDVIARITNGSKTTSIKAFKQGYFIAGTDGAEGKWRYSALWPDFDSVPEIPKLKKLSDGAEVAGGGAIGKIVAQPQDLRFIGLAENEPKLAEQIKNRRVRVMMDDEDTVTRAEVSIGAVAGGKLKFVVFMPWFRDEDIVSRGYKLIIELGSVSGAVVPMTAVTEHNGKKSVLLLRGSRTVYKAVQGMQIAENSFLITDGIVIGDAVVEKAEGAKEGRVQLW